VCGAGWGCVWGVAGEANPGLFSEAAVQRTSHAASPSGIATYNTRSRIK
jgi:hypothetical protein